MPDLIGMKLRIHVHKSAGESPIPKFSSWSGERGFAAGSKEQVEPGGETWGGQLATTVTEVSADTGYPDPGQNSQLQMRQEGFPRRAQSQTEMRPEQE